MEAEGKKQSIYRFARTIKRKDNSLFNALRSIYEDSIFVGEISQLWPQLPLLANLRCGLWYSSESNFHSTCYFKSTDGHNNNWSFNTSRLNLHVALLSGQKGGCIIVDSTRKGKRFPDSMSKTIPIWACVLNRGTANQFKKMIENGEDKKEVLSNWDTSLHLPIWVSQTERASIEDRVEEWTSRLESCGADIESLALSLKKPLRPLWISQSTVIWLNEVPDHNSWEFTPIILVNASSSSNANIQRRTSSEHSWNYIPGAGDDEESWARGLTPSLFWKNAYDLMNSGPDVCNKKVAEIVEKDRVHRAQRGQNAPQISVKPSKLFRSKIDTSSELTQSSPNSSDMIINKDGKVSWISNTNVAVAAIRDVNMADAECTLNCSMESISECHGIYSHIPVMNSKMARFSLLDNLPRALKFAKSNLNQGRTFLVCCHDGEDISVCVCLAILMSLYDDTGNFDDGKFFQHLHVSKLELRKRLVFVCKYVLNARPSRGNLRQVFMFLTGGKAAQESFQIPDCSLPPQPFAHPRPTSVQQL